MKTKDYTLYHALRTHNINIELRKHFDDTYSVVDIDKVCNETHHIRDKFGRAEAKYKQILTNKTSHRRQ
jgi:hypothetical protein